MFTFLIVIITLIAILLTLVVLLQSGKGGGLAGIAAGGTTQVLGARQAPDVLEKATWTLAVAFIVLCILTNFFVPGAGDAGGVLETRGADVEAIAPGLERPDSPAIPENPPASEGQGAEDALGGGN